MLKLKVITLLSSYMMVSFQSIRLRFENYDNILLFVEKFTMYFQCAMHI